MKLVATIKDSLLQGSLIISDHYFRKHFPNHGGHHYFLIDSTPGKDEFVKQLKRSLSDQGIAITTTAERLNTLHAVENAYISIFQTLGGLGFLIGSLGLGIITTRNLLDRRKEFSIMLALGFTQKEIRRLAYIELRQLIAWGLSLGILSSLLAIWPSISNDMSLESIGLKIAFTGSLVTICILCGLLPINTLLKRKNLQYLRIE